jgi:hypothetical protein
LNKHVALLTNFQLVPYYAFRLAYKSLHLNSTHRYKQTIIFNKKLYDIHCRKRYLIFIRPSLRRDVLWYTNVRLSVRPSVSHSNLRTPWPIHFKFHRVIGIDGLTVCILYGEISNFHSRVMGLYSSHCRRFFVCRAVNWELLGQLTSNFAQLVELIVLWSVYFLVKFRFFIPELWDFIHQIVGNFSYVAL